jgi:hypothetical protein
MAQRYLKPEDCKNIDPNENISSFNCSESPRGGKECEGVGTGGQFKDCQTCLDQCPRSPSNSNPNSNPNIKIIPTPTGKSPIQSYSGGSNKLSTNSKIGIGAGVVVGVVGIIGIIIFLMRRKK